MSMHCIRVTNTTETELSKRQIQNAVKNSRSLYTTNATCKMLFAELTILDTKFNLRRHSHLFIWKVFLYALFKQKDNCCSSILLKDCITGISWA